MDKKVLIWLQKRFKTVKDESGQTLVIVLIMLLLGGLIIAPLLAFMGTGLKSGILFEDKTRELYAADSGIDDGMWQIEYDDLDALDTPSSYEYYDYSTEWSYQLANQVNSKDVDVTIKNVWIPKDISLPSESYARNLIESGKLIVTGTISGSGTYQIKLSYYGCAGEDLRVRKIGIWLPPGFDYVEESSNLEADEFASYYSVPTTEPYQGGQAVIWDFSLVPYDEFPYVDSGAPEGTPKTTEVTLGFDGPSGQNPSAISWIETSGVADIPYSWDADTQIYKITSQAGDAELEAYTAKSGIRELGSAISGDYYAVGNSLMIDEDFYSPPIRDTLLSESDAEVSAIPSTAVVEAAFLYWSAWISGEIEQEEQVLFYDDCSDFSDWNNPGSDWLISSGRFRGHHLGNDPDRYLPMQHSLDLSAYSGKMVTVSWNQSEQGYLESYDRLYFGFSGDGGSSWSSDIEAFRDDNPPSDFSYQIPQEYLTANFKLRFFLYYFDGWGEYCYLDNITISVSNGLFSDDCSSFDNWTHSNDWSLYYGAFRGHYSGGNRLLTMNSSLDLSSYSSLSVSWEQWEGGNLESDDCLRFAFSGNGGTTWSSYSNAFCNDIGSYPQEFSIPIPSEYLTDDFRMRFYASSLSGYGEYCYIDNIIISEASEAFADTSAIFKINGQQVYLDESGEPQQGSEEITASEYSTLENQPGEYSYACYLDVTELVQEFSNEGDFGNRTGNATYTVGGVYGDTDDEWSYAAWSLIIIYSSPETKGHQLYLYDDFVYSGMDTNVDFDGDGEDGGTITGFIVPEQIEGEGNDDDAARLTCFVGEGDDYYDGDYLRFNGSSQSDGRSTNDVWNSWSTDLSEDGIDIDTFHITWGDGLLDPGDTSAQIDLPTQTDSWNLVYIILSFRSEVTAGGTLSYLIRN